MPDILVWSGLVVLGVAVGTYGGLIGAGGGFVLVPVLLLLYPSESPELITTISLVVVSLNALSGTVAYVRQRRIDYLAGNLFAIATVPGAIAGALTVALIPRRAFNLLFGLVLLAIAGFLQTRRTRVADRRHRRGEVSRLVTDAHGDSYAWSYNPSIGFLFSLIIGFVSSLLGIGGGVIHVPLMIQILRFPAHVATATSQYILTVTALTGVTSHLLAGDITDGYRRMAALGVGVVLGAQVGVFLSLRLKSSSLVRLLSAALIAVGFRLLLSGVGL